MKIKYEYRECSALEIWDKVCDSVRSEGGFRSVSGIGYEAAVRSNTVYYKGGSGKRERFGEYLDRETFLRAYGDVRALPVVNTCTVKPFIARRQTPFIGLLLSAGILE